MSNPRALNDEEVQAEMKKMVAFIKQEALEKAREVKFKADEEFNIEKAKLVRQETTQIDSVFQRKFKQAEVQKKIAQSNHLNKCRLKILQTRQDLLQTVYQDAKAKIQEITNNQEQYRSLMSKLLTQGIYQLLEEDLKVQCRKKDADLVKSLIPEVTADAQKKLKLNVKLTLDESEFLTEESLGGVVLLCQNDRIKCMNSLKNRLDGLAEMMLPQIRTMLYGPSPNRKFFD